MACMCLPLLAIRLGTFLIYISDNPLGLTEHCFNFIHRNSFVLGSASHGLTGNATDEIEQTMVALAIRHRLWVANSRVMV